MPSLDGYIQDRLNNPVHVPGHGTIKSLRLEAPSADLVVKVVEARLRSAPTGVSKIEEPDAGRSGKMLWIAIGGVAAAGSHTWLALHEAGYDVIGDVHGCATELERLLASATLVAQPSLEEGFGLPVAEALAAGIPVAISTAKVRVYPLMTQSNFAKSSSLDGSDARSLMPVTSMTRPSTMPALKTNAGFSLA